LNGCSTPAPRSSAAKQQFQQLVQTKEDPFRGESHIQWSANREVATPVGIVGKYFENEDTALICLFF